MGNEHVREIPIGETTERFEVEVKGFVTSLPDHIRLQLQSAPYIDIVQGYFPDGTRLRQENFSDGGETVYSKTTKSKDAQAGNEHVRLETETRLSKADFLREWTKIDRTHFRILRKRRFRIEDGNGCLELNLFIGGGLDGRFVAEKEFEVRENNYIEAARLARDYEFPDWITKSEAASSKKLARRSIKEPSKVEMPPLAPRGIIYVDLLKDRDFAQDAIIFPNGR